MPSASHSANNPASEPERRALQWQFVSENSAWKWRKLLADGALDLISEREFPDYAFAVNDAINHGFRPRRDYWVIVTENGTTHFRSGQPPAFVPRREGEAFPPLAPRETKPARVRSSRKSVPEQ